MERARDVEAIVALEQLVDRLALGVLHRQEEPLVGELPEVVDRDDVRVAQPVDRAGLAPEPRHELRIIRQRARKDLERFLAAERDVLGEDRPRPSRPAQVRGCASDR